MRRVRQRTRAGGVICAVLTGLITFLPAAAACAAARALPPSVIVRVAQGKLAGLRQGPVNAFLGVPYAAPPIGRDRWRAPQPAPHWQGVRAADRFAPSCWQTILRRGLGPWAREFLPQGRVSEDCLYLNVWSPATVRRRRLPVLVWIPGGGFVSGSGSVALYDGARLAARGIIVVTINYRVGILGFLVTPALAAEAAREHAPAGNYGLQDMIAALRWVHRNIAAFGGDPDAVTVAGQSAGSIAVHDLIVSPLANGLFTRAMAQSGLPDTVPVPSLSVAEQAGEAFARSKGAPTLSALRALPPQALSTTDPPLKGPLLLPIVDGTLLPATPESLVRAGRLADVPVLGGIDADEATAFSGRLRGSMSQAAWQALLVKEFGALAPRFASLYPAGTGRERARSARQLHRDLGLAELWRWSQARLAHARSPAYGYLFDHREPGSASGWGVFHSSELPYVFGTLDAAPQRHFTRFDRALSRTLSGYWINFVKTGNPNGPGMPRWPRMRGADPRIMVLGRRLAPRPILPARKLAMMEAFIAGGGRPKLWW
ncbi:MAG TPA: carboxylesterase family protein [Steroidobacteraceae bacterium]|nr:carboxylesterase family protein [Steroidobacteraceae bacterium]